MKTLLLATTALCLLLAYVANPLMVERRNQRILNELAAKGVKTNIVGLLNADQSLRRTLVSYLGVPAYPHLYALDFRGVDLGQIDLSDLEDLDSIEQLDFSGTGITDKQLEQLPTLPFLEELCLNNTQVTDKAVEQVTRFLSLASLEVMGTSVTYKTLDMLDSQLKYAGFAEEKAINELLAAGHQVPHTPRFQEYDDKLRFHSVIDSGLQALDLIVGMKAKPVPFSAAEVHHLNHMTSLPGISFRQVQLGQDGLTKLARLPALRTMEFSFVNLSDADLKAISRQTQLEKLELHYAEQLTDEGLQHLQLLSNLREFAMSNCPRISSQAILDLQQTLPECDFDFSPLQSQETQKVEQE